MTQHGDYGGPRSLARVLARYGGLPRGTAADDGIAGEVDQSRGALGEP
jgi:hypothetical protein